MEQDQDYDEQQETHHFLAMWDSWGFETIIDVTAEERDAVWSTLKGVPKQANIPYNAMLLRAKFNPQRSPEIYTFSASIDLETLRKYADESPQQLVNLIRDRGHKLYGEPKQKDVIV